MFGYAAPGDTWGIEGPTFIWLYLGAAALILAGTAVHRLRLYAGDPAVRLRELDAEAVGYLTGGARRAVYTSLGKLSGAAAVKAGRDGVLTATGALCPEATPLDTAIYNAASQHKRIRQLAADPLVRD